MPNDDVGDQVQQLKKDVAWLDEKVRDLLRAQNTNVDKLAGHDGALKKLGERVSDLEKKAKK